MHDFVITGLIGEYPSVNVSASVYARSSTRLDIRSKFVRAFLSASVLFLFCVHKRGGSYVRLPVRASLRLRLSACARLCVRASSCARVSACAVPNFEAAAFFA